MKAEINRKIEQESVTEFDRQILARDLGRGLIGHFGLQKEDQNVYCQFHAYSNEELDVMVEYVNEKLPSEHRDKLIKMLLNH